MRFNYKYDQLNRLTETFTYKGLNAATNSWNKTALQDYREQLNYDANGNIKTYVRNGTGVNINLNNYTYTYQSGTNRLTNITNSINGNSSNYQYDSIGNVIKDDKQNVAVNNWNVYGKLQSVQKTNGNIINYNYNAAGHRVSKTVVSGVSSVSEFYVRDAAGNVMATYKKDPTINNGHLSAVEFYKYGSSLLSIKNKTIDVEVPAPVSDMQTDVVGEDNYQITDQNGNVIVVLSDKRIPHDDNNDGMVDYYTADVKSATHYSAFGAMSKSYNGDSIPFAFNGQKRSMEISPTAQTAEFWEYNGDVGRRWNLDVRPNVSISPYAAFENNPIYNTDILGDTSYPTPGGGKIYTEDAGAKTFDGSVQKVGNINVQPAKGTLRSFTVRGDNVDNGAARFVAKFNTSSGKFMGYGWDKDMNYTYDDLLKDFKNDLADQLANADNPMYQHYNNREDALKSAINLGIGLVLFNPILKTTTAAANAGKATASTASTSKTGFTLTKHGELTNGTYTVSKDLMKPHVFGGVQGKSIFYPTINANETVLKAAQYADETGLWIGNKAKVPVLNSNIGTTGLGKTTNIINVYRKPNGFIHGAPGN